MKLTDAQKLDFLIDKAKDGKPVTEKYPQQPETFETTQPEPHEYRTKQRVTFYRYTPEGIEPIQFGWLLRGVGRHYIVNGERVSIGPVSAGPVKRAREIERTEFDELLQRYVLPPAFDDEPAE